MTKPNKKKVIIAVIAAVLAVAVAVTSVLLVIKNRDDETDDYTDYDPVKYDENYIDPADSVNVFELDYAEPEPIAVNKKLNDPVKADASDFVKTLSAKEISFDYAKYYGTEKSIKSQKKLPHINGHKHDITGGTGVIDEDELYNAVVSNNNEYFEFYKNQKDDINAEVQLYEKAPKKHIKLACRYIAEYVNKAAASDDWQDVDFDRVYCNLATLKVMHGISADFSLAYVDENNIMSINAEAIDSKKTFVAFDDSMSDEELEQFAWDTTIVHEVMHLLQSTCRCYKGEDDYMIGNMYMPAEKNTSPLMPRWLVEASAELEMANMLKVEPVTYFNYINYYYSMLCSYVANTDTSIQKIMRITYDGNNYPFYKAFGKLSDEQTVELVNTLYSVEVMDSMPADFVNAYREDTGIDLNDREDEAELVRQKLRVNVLSSFTKTFYISLAKQVSEGRMSYNDMFYLIRLFERAMFEHLMYNENDRLMISNVFFDEYLSVQDAFFDAIANDVITADDLAKELDRYTQTCKVGKKTADNYSLNWMSSEQKDAMEKIESNYIFINLPSIRSVKALYVQNGYDKSTKY